MDASVFSTYRGPMEWLNYHHLLYFWVVAREGGLAPAGRLLRLAHPTLSGQIKALEESLGEKLFAKSGRRLVLTDTGRVVYRYADEIFTLGREMLDTVRGRPTGQPVRLDVGIADVVPKLIVKRLLEPAFSMPEPVRLVCQETDFERLLSRLSLHEVDVVIADSPVPAGSSIRAFNHLLGECGVTFFGDAKLARQYAKGFPASLDGAPMLLPLDDTILRRSLNQWFDRLGVRPRIVAELEDSALAKVFGADGRGILAAPSAVRAEVEKMYDLHVVGETEDVQERFYAITAERKLKNPAVVAICEAARHELFAR